MEPFFVSPPLIGIVGSAGAYGRWLRHFFETRMGLAVIGHDPADPDSLPEIELARRADVMYLFRADPACRRDHRALHGAGRRLGSRQAVAGHHVDQGRADRRDAAFARRGGRPASDDRAAQGADPEGPGDGGVRGAAGCLASLAGRTAARAGGRVRPRRTRTARSHHGAGAGDGACQHLASGVLRGQPGVGALRTAASFLPPSRWTRRSCRASCR